jgi:hypothetical protein
MQELGTLLKEFGPWFLFLLVLLANLKQIGAGIERFLQRLFPSLEARAKFRREAEQLAREQAISERMDTILVFKDLMLEYRTRLDKLDLQNRQERTDHEARILEIVRGYERSQAQTVEVLRDVSDVIRSQTARLDVINGWIKQQGR